jgi:hypothetical protein
MHGEARNERTTRRTFALLVALAGLAERAAGRCFPLRFLVLFLLRHAEELAREYVAGAMGVDGLWFDDGMEHTSRPVDAALLAERFRLLAAELRGLLPPDGRFGAAIPRRDAVPRGAASRPATPLFASAALALVPFDTS